ncbi:MAG: hypothetical protein K0R28_5406, partial [Paenibacillus sp.]|nr:hypothetical protein [Paenibacillus sp.]
MKKKIAAGLAAVLALTMMVGCSHGSDGGAKPAADSGEAGSEKKETVTLKIAASIAA